ncbi:MAG: amino acid ABC transporter substrate-binding protein [Bauldia sp.]|nr:amino acid ABC transporter substrate-binding protein [Bauldia sp.]
MNASRLVALVAGALVLAPSLAFAQAPAAPSAGPPSAGPPSAGPPSAGPPSAGPPSAGAPAAGAPTRPAPPPIQPVPIGYVELAGDARYDLMGAYANIDFREFGRPWEGAEVALKEGQQSGSFMRLEFSLNRFTGTNSDEMAAQIREWNAAGSNYVVLDLPAYMVAEVADKVADLPVMLFNVSARDDSLRNEACRANVFHTIPSEAQYQDTLVQYLVNKRWTNILVLQGPANDDALMVAALQRSVVKFGARVVEVVPFVVTNDPRYRDQTNVALMTANRPSYDVVYVADSGHEFGRFVPFQTNAPRPVVGTAGLQPRAWHWTWDHDDAAQLQHRFEANSLLNVILEMGDIDPARLQQRFEANAMPRQMNDGQFAAWVAVRSVYINAIRNRGNNYDAIREHMLSEDANLDSLKGNPMTFRTWDNQVRTPMLLATADAVIARAPFAEYLHSTNVLDTLGIDGPETRCRFQR